LRLFAISNIHGYYDEFMALLDYVQYDPCSDQLFILGGLVDYGPKSLEVVEECIRLQKEGATILRGQREQLYINAFACDHFPSEETLCKTKNTLVYFYHDHPSIKDRHIEFFRSLPFYTEYGDYVLSHAGMDINYKDNFAYCLGNRDFFLTPEEELKKTGKIYVFGYTPVFVLNPDHSHALFKKPHLIGIDFGAGRHPLGTLAIVELGQQKYYKIKVA